MNLDKLDNEYESFKNEYTYQYLKYLGEKCQEMIEYAIEHNTQTVENEFYLNFIIISPETSGMGRNLALNFSFSFEDDTSEINDFNFTTNDTFEHSINDHLINADIMDKLNEVYQLCHNQEKKELHLMLAKRLKQNLEEIPAKKIIFSKNYENHNQFKNLLGQEFYARYEKEKLDSTVSQKIGKKNKKQKI